MKHLITTILLAALMILPAAAQRQDSTTAATEKLDFESADLVTKNYFESVKLHLSKDWRKSWRPEVSARITSMFYVGSYDLTLGIRTSPNKVFGVGAASGEVFLDAIPARSKRVNFYLYHRHYIPLDRKRRISLYSDLFGGGTYVYKISCDVRDKESIHPNEGEMRWYYMWQPGISIRLWGKSNVFLGPSLGPSIGLHLGLAL